MFLDLESIHSIWLTIKLALIVSILLVIFSTMIAWWIFNCKKWYRIIVESIISLPIILPPTVLGFYLLLAMGPKGPIGKLTNLLNISPLPFTFWGLVVASLFYSLPFVVRPIQIAFESMGHRPLEVAATLGAGPIDRFFTIAIPQASSGILTAIIIGFAHTIGEFGVILMIGGNIPGETKVVSVEIFEQVEMLNYSKAHILSAIMLLFSFIVLTLLHFINRKSKNKFY